MPVDLGAQQAPAPNILQPSDTTFHAIYNRMNDYFASTEWQSNNDGGDGDALVEKNKVKANLISIAPNPASTKVKITYDSPSIYGNTGSIEITSTYGKTLYSGNINDQSKTFEVDVQDWPNGTYFCLYKKETGSVKVIPFIVNH